MTIDIGYSYQIHPMGLCVSIDVLEWQKNILMVARLRRQNVNTHFYTWIKKKKLF